VRRRLFQGFEESVKGLFGEHVNFVNARKAIEPALAQYRDLQARGATHVPFQQHFAQALYVQALAQPADPDGTARRRDELGEATRLLQAEITEAFHQHAGRGLPEDWLARGLVMGASGYAANCVRSFLTGA
jgi:hypothetical protein